MVIINPPERAFPKPFKIIDYKAKEPSLLQRHVIWLKRDHGKYNVLVKALKIVEIFFATITLLFIPLLYKTYKISAQIDDEKKFQRSMANVQRPDSNMHFELKSANRTFTHTHEIIIENDVLWSRPRHSDNEWTPMYFDGFKDKKKPIAVSADGANLIVLDEDHRVHYRKLIREYRSEEITPKNKRAQEFVKNTDVDLQKDPYIVVDKVEKNNWKEKWFSLPIASSIIQLFKQSKKLGLPSDARAVAISHRGRYNDYLEDGVKAHHPVSTGVTTLYVLENNGKIIRKYDPWSPEFAKMNIHVPETSTSTFEAINMDASASHLMLLGYETTKNREEKGVFHRLTIKTKLADIDSEGWNPGLKYGYVPNEKDPNVRVISSTTWRDHPLDLEEGAQITKNISIVQMGEGNDAREIRIEGWNVNGVKGYYYKMVDDNDWQFKPFKEGECGSNDLPLKNEEIKKKDPEGVFNATVSDYEAKQVKFNALNNTQPLVTLKDFGIGNNNSPLTVRMDNVDYTFNLHRKKTLKNFLGIEGDSFDLVVPSDLHKDVNVNKLFRGKKSMSVNVSLKDKPSELTLKASDFSITLAAK